MPVNYDVNAFLKTSGSFAKQFAGGASAADSFGSKWDSVGGKVEEAGRRIAGSFASITGQAMRMGAALGGAGITGFLTMATTKGVQFNRNMEDSALATATMFQTFKIGAKAAEVISGETSEWAKNLELAKAMQGEIYDIAKKSPATFAEIDLAYQSMASGLSGVTTDLERQRKIVEQTSVLAGLVSGDYKQLGGDIGRIVGGQAGADVQMFKKLEKPFGEAMAEVTQKQVPTDLAKAFNALEPEKRLQVLEKVLGRIPPEVGEAYGQSFGGILSTTVSALEGLAGKFAGPLTESLKKSFTRANDEAGIFGGENLKRLESAAIFAGEQLGNAASRLLDALMRGIDYVSRNYDKIAATLREAGVAAGAALKAAMVVGTTRMVAGLATAGAGRAIAGGAAMAPAMKQMGGFFGKHARKTHRELGRGMARKGGKDMGLTRTIGSTLADVFGKIGGGKGPLRFFRGLDKGVLKLASMSMMVTALGTAAVVAGAALGGVAVVVGGIAAYVISNWEKISMSLRQGLEDGRITLVPLITSLYTFYLRLQLVGEALIGGRDAAGTFGSLLSLVTKGVDVASSVLGYFIQGLSILVGAFGAVKLAFAGLMKVMLTGVKALSQVGLVDEAAVNNAQANFDSFWTGVEDTFTTADQLARAAEAVKEARLDPMDMRRAEEDARKLEKGLSDALAGMGKDADKKKGRAPGKATTIHAKIEIDARDTDPDRLMGALVKKMESLSDKRDQPYGALEQGG